MDKFVIQGIPSFDGDYPIELGGWTMRELHIIKRISGVRGGEMSEAFKAGDTDLMLAMAVIAVRRNNRDWEAFEKHAWETDAIAITFVDGDQEEAAGEPVPLTLAPSDATGNSNDSQPRSGTDSPDGGADSPATNPHPIGAPH